MKKHVLYQLSICIQVIHHYRFFAQQKPKYLYIELIRCSCRSADTGRIGTDHPDTRLNWCFWCQKHRVRWFRNPTSHGESTILCLGQVKKSEHLVEMEGIFQPSKKHVIWTPLLPGKTWHETFPSPGWWIPTNRKSGWFQIHPRKSTWNLKMKVRKMIFFFKQVIFRFHVHFPGCMFYFNIPKLGEDEPILTNSFQMGWFIQPPTRFKFS